MTPLKRPAPPLPVGLYCAMANLIGPLAYRRISAKLTGQGVSPARLRERLGKATAKRPEGRVLWFHAASVGESLSVLALIQRLGEQKPDLSFLLTSGTATSAEIVARRLPPRTQHQFAPLDTRRAVTRFLTHWMPNAAVFVESELWPNMLSLTQAAGVPMALINARISDRSARNWKRAPETARYLLAGFRMIHCQDDRTASHLADLGMNNARVGINLKSLSGAVPFDCAERDRIAGQIGPRPLWLAASTHPGEDEIMLQAHKAVLKTFPNALLVLIPRHPDRAGDIAALIRDAGLHHATRSGVHDIQPDTQVYLADTLGETGLFYALSPLTCLCGSFTPVGGHNPFEPAHARSAILHGPLYANFTPVYARLSQAGAAVECADAQALGADVLRLLTDETALTTLRDAAHRFATAQTDALDTLGRDLSKALQLG